MIIETQGLKSGYKKNIAHDFNHREIKTKKR